MSNSTPVRCRTIENVDLPAPATKLIITQHLKASRDSPYWAWIIVGAFYDGNNNVLSTEVFAGRLEVDSDSDEETVDGESESESGSSEAASDTEDTSSGKPWTHGIGYRHSCTECSIKTPFALSRVGLTSFRHLSSLPTPC